VPYSTAVLMQVRFLDSANSFQWPDYLVSSNSVPISPTAQTEGGGRGGDYCDDDGSKEIVLDKKR
jgi:hypothetical protein